MRNIIESDFEHKGLRCIVMFGDLGHRCGYVGVPERHPFHGKDYADSALRGIECHGGLTFSGGRGYPAPMDGTWWFGFDCAHAFDSPDLEELQRRFPEREIHKILWSLCDGHVWTKEEVEDECRRLADQLAQEGETA